MSKLGDAIKQATCSHDWKLAYQEQAQEPFVAVGRERMVCRKCGREGKVLKEWDIYRCSQEEEALRLDLMHELGVTDAEMGERLGAYWYQGLRSTASEVYARDGEDAARAYLLAWMGKP